MVVCSNTHSGYTGIPDGNLPAHANTTVTRGQLFTLVYAYMTRHALTKAAVSDLITLLNTLMPGCLPDNLYYFTKFLHSPYDLDTFVYCNECETFLGKFDGELLKHAICRSCEKDRVFDDMVRLGCFFIIYPLEKSLRHLLEVQGFGQLLIDNSTHCQDDSLLMGDISDGVEYRRKNVEPFPASLSLTCNIDGVPVFKSSNTSMWPVFYVVNNLPFSDRRDNVLLHGLWCGAGKPK